MVAMKIHLNPIVNESLSQNGGSLSGVQLPTKIIILIYAAANTILRKDTKRQGNHAGWDEGKITLLIP